MKKLIIFPIMTCLAMLTVGILMLSGVNISNSVRANGIVSASSESRMEIDIVETGETSTGQHYLALVNGFELSNLVGFWGGISLTIEISSTDCRIFVFEHDTAYGFVMRDFSTTTPDTPAYDVDRVYVAGNELIVQEKSGQKFHFDITGATQVKTNFYGEVKATFASNMIWVENIAVSNPIDLMTQNIEVDINPTWSENNTRTIIELSNDVKVEITTRPWEPLQGITIIVSMYVYEWKGGEWRLTGLPEQTSGGAYVGGFVGYVKIRQDGGYLIISYDVDLGADTRVFAVDMKGSTQARISVENAEYLGQVFASGTIASDISFFTFTMLGLDGELLQVLTLPRNSHLKWNMFEPFLPSHIDAYRVVAVSGNTFDDYFRDALLTQNTVWRLVSATNMQLSFQLTGESTIYPMVSVPYGGSVTKAQIPPYQGFIPSLFFFGHWETVNGIALDENLIIKNDMTFYPIIKSSYTLENQLTNEITHQAKSYTNDELAKHFSQYGYMRSSDLTTQSRSNPIALTSLQILNFRFPYGIPTNSNGAYFEIEISNTKQEVLRLKRNTSNVVLEIGHGNSWTTFTTIPISKWETRRTGTDNPTTKNPIRWNQFTFEIDVSSVDIAWSLDWGLSDNTTSNSRSGLIPFYSLSLSNKNGQTGYFIGITDLKINPFVYSKNFLDGWRENTFLGLDGTGTGYGDKYIAEYLQHYYPGLRLQGYEAIGAHNISLYLNGQNIGSTVVAPNVYEYPELPSEYVQSGYSVVWYIDPQMTTALDRNHTMSMFTALYGKLVQKRYEVSLSFYTLTKEWVSGSSLFYEALTWKTEYRWFNAGETITADRFGTNENGRPFYNRVAGIEFLGWSGGIGVAANSDKSIVGNYRLPQITVRYFDINNNLYGEVKSDVELFDLSLLHNQIQLLELSEGATPPQSDSPQEWEGLIFGFARLVRIALFGGDDNTFNENALKRDAQIKESRAIVRRLILEYSADNQIFFPIVRLDINLENLDKGNYENTNFYVDPVLNSQWRLLNGTPEANNLIYYVDFHDYFSLNSTHNFTLVINFKTEQQWYDRFNLSNILGGIFGGLDNWAVIIGLGILLIFCFPLVIVLIKAVLAIVTLPIRWLGKKAGG